MTTGTIEGLRGSPAVAAAVTVTLAAVATILGAFVFQYGFKLAPCPLCLEQRIPYYVVIPVGSLVAVAAWLGAPRPVVALGLGVILLAMLWGAGLAGYHSGVEWRFWPGPQDCSGPIDKLGSAGSLMSRLQSFEVVRCDEAAWRFLGLSLAGYNVLISLALAGVAAWGLRETLRRRAG